jgi:hypothetical protein
MGKKKDDKDTETDWFAITLIFGLAFIWLITIAALIAFDTDAGEDEDDIDSSVKLDGNGQYVTSIPQHVMNNKIGFNSYKIGKRIVDGNELEGYLVVHTDGSPNNDTQSPLPLPQQPTSNISSNSVISRAITPKCYGQLASNVKINPGMGYYINPDNQYGISPNVLLSIIDAAMQEWNSATTRAILFGGFRGYITNQVDVTRPNGRNEIMFAPIDMNGVIAFTVTWIDWRSRRIVEWDQVYNTDLDWSIDGVYDSMEDLMDVRNIATHELGHSIGLADQEDVACSEATMYAYARYGEIKKSTLEQADRNGVNSLYGRVAVMESGNGPSNSTEPQQFTKSAARKQQQDIPWHICAFSMIVLLSFV